MEGRTTPRRQESSQRPTSQKRLPIAQWKSRVNAQYPADLGWDTLAKIPAMRPEHDAEDDRNNTRGLPRPGAALVPGSVYWGECSPNMLGQ